MRFKPYPSPRPRLVTHQRLRRAQHALDRERARWGMFADQMVTETAEERVARVDEGVLAGVKQMRDHQAAMWRRGRRALYALPTQERQELLRQWNQSPLPGTPEYFLDFLHSHGVRARQKRR
jgi:hypothetical protein